MIVFLKESVILGTFLSAILMAARVGKEVVGAALPAPESLLVSTSVGLMVRGRTWTVFSTIGHRVGVVQEALLERVRESSKRLEGKREEVMGLGVHSGISFICASGDSVMIRFSIKMRSMRCEDYNCSHRRSLVFITKSVSVRLMSE
jgi:hypothetical protein